MCVSVCVCVRVPDSERSLFKSQYSSSSRLRGHLDRAPWKPNKAAAGQPGCSERGCVCVCVCVGVCERVSELKLRVGRGRCPLSGQHLKCSSYLGNTSLESLPRRAFLFLMLD